jgi:hypothetical protein
MRHNLAATGALAAVVTLTAAPRPAGAGDDVVVLYSAGLNRLLADEKDQGLLDALHLVDERLAELPAELDEPGMPVPVIELVLDLMASPVLLQAGGIEDPNAEVPFYAQLTLKEPDAGPTFAERTARLMGLFGLPEGMPLAGNPSISVADLDGVGMYYGRPRDGAFTLALNRFDPARKNPPNPGLPEGVEPVLAFSFNAQAAQPFFEMMLEQMGAARQLVRDQLDLYGLLGPDATSFSIAVGYGDDRMHGTWRYTNYAQLAERWHALVREPLDRRDLTMVPADATFAEVGTYRISGLGDLIRQWTPVMEEAGVEEMEDPLALFAEHTGVDLERDVLAHFGDSYGFYMSDTTGGGGFMSAIMFMRVTNPRALDESLHRLAKKVNELASEHARGYVRMQDYKRDGLPVTTLTFPGLPIPLEISWTITDRYLILGATPHAVTAAARQSMGAGPSLLDNRKFTQMGGTHWEGASYVTFADTPRLARSGYGFAQLACSAIANGVRSPVDPQRDPGVILPPFNALMNGAKASVSLYRLDGNDLTGTFQADRSFMVNLCGGLGMIGQSGAPIAVAAMGAGVLLPSLDKAREQAREAKASAQVRQLCIALMIYAAENDDAAPPDWAALEPYLGPGLLDSPYGPVSDGRGDYWMNTSVARVSELRRPDELIAFYDRAMYEHTHEVAVGFYDGHAEVVSAWEFEALIEEAPNAGIDFDLPESW